MSERVDDIKRDPIGMAIADFYRSGKDLPIEVFINGKQDAPMMPSLFFRTYSKMKGYERLALRMCKGSVLDIGAAAGCHSLILQKRNLDVTSLEISPLACAVLTARGVRRVVNENIFDVKGIEFNTILMLMNGLGMAGSEEGTAKLLRHLKRMLAHKGMILGDSTDILYNTMDVNKAFDEKENYYGQVEFRLKYDGVEADPFQWIYLDPALLSELCDKVGLQCQILHRDENFHYLAKITK